MERVLEGAVEHGATIIRDRLQAIAPDAPAQMLILDNPRVRGFRLDGYGVFFDVEVPSLNGTLTWSLRTLDQNDLGLQSALNVLKARLDPADVDLQQALKRLELQVGPLAPASQAAPVPAAPRVPRLPNPRRASGSAASAADPQVGATAVRRRRRPRSRMTGFWRTRTRRTARRSCRPWPTRCSTTAARSASATTNG